MGTRPGNLLAHLGTSASSSGMLSGLWCPHQLKIYLEILQIYLAIDFDSFPPWWLETHPCAHTHSSFLTPISSPRLALQPVLHSCLWGLAFLTGFPVTLSVLISKRRKTQLEVWATGIKGQASKPIAKQEHLWIYGHSLLLATSVLLVGSASLNEALVALAFPQHQ